MHDEEGLQSYQTQKTINLRGVSQFLVATCMPNLSATPGRNQTGSIAAFEVANSIPGAAVDG